MILFENSIVKLDYDPATDIVEIEYPDLHGFLLPEIKHTITILVDYIRNYDVKRMLLDSTKTMVSVSEEESREVAMTLAAGVMKTRVEKVARVQSPSEAVEQTSERNIHHLKQTQQLPFELRNFTSKAEAIAWLKGQQA
ncbi:hypothetical protein [Pontibacter anaerobius]|uniref:STAS/SEC14 domain-containing protein n=1 Tax=Pontibacter anaerobius TaxID=2993940 RepID=A0ABT3REC3_9BACT|nr:hypothetical protein [Pontibacter anaerobius]MCX2739788.1 hypothetical protein [Pontibacter anaerobius]